MSKKLLIAIGIFAMLTVMIAPVVLAVDLGSCEPGEVYGVTCGITTDSGEITTVGGAVGVFTKIVQWVYTILFIVAVLFILIAAFYFITSSGDDTKVKKAKSMLLYAVIGIVVALLSWGVVKFLQGSLISGGGVL